ncbi:MAG TPA: protease inhibitor I42 family protein [Mucilaginibacter sp.]|nr:protease inhibitor I42 family protein [Mucilaginibacter sp.]
MNNGNADKTLLIKKGQVFTLTLPSGSDDGYRFDSTQYNRVILGLQKRTTTSPAPGSLPGAAGARIWQFMVAVPQGLQHRTSGSDQSSGLFSTSITVAE